MKCKFLSLFSSRFYLSFVSCVSCVCSCSCSCSCVCVCDRRVEDDVVVVVVVMQ